MTDRKTQIVVNKLTILFLVLVNVIVIRHGYIINEKWYWLLLITLPLFLLAMFHARQKRRSQLKPMNKRPKLSGRNVLNNSTTQMGN